MLYYRIFPFHASAIPGQPGHATYLYKPQGPGRLDNPRYYEVWYLAADMSGAVGEVFGDLPTWSDAMFDFPKIPGSRKAIGVFELPDDLPILDLDDARNLLDRGLRPTQVVERNRSASQSWALKIWQECAPASGDPTWHGVRWWSFHRPQWRVLGVWGHSPICRDVQVLSVDHVAVRDAASQLRKRVM
jgi:hypothetical protein